MDRNFRFFERDCFIPQDTILRKGVELWYGKVQNVYSPIYSVNSGKPFCIGHYPMMSGRDSLNCLDLAEAAWGNGNGEWPTLSHKERIKAVLNFVNLMELHRTEILRTLMWEICKTRPDAESEFDRTVAYIKDSCKELEKLSIDWGMVREEGGLLIQEDRAPRGIVLCMGPSNYPLNETFTTLLPALLMGNVVLFKPAKVGVLLLEPLLKCFAEAFPMGTVTTLYGEGGEVISPIIRSGRVDVFAFIGSSWVADKILQQHPAPHRCKIILGLEAKNPGIILPNADLDNAVKHCVKGALSYNGQRCTALKVLFVHKSNSEAFREKFVAAVNALKYGLPWEYGVQLTPVLPGSIDRFQALLTDSTTRGAEVLNANGGKVVDGYMHPAVLYPVNEQMRLYREEQFGPLVPIIEYENLDEVVNWQVKLPYGQQLSVFGGEADLEQIKELKQLTKNQVCRFNINTSCQRGPDNIPFTGRKDSAAATLSLRDALLEFSIENVTAAPSSGSLLVESVKK
ncbi:MAG: aldehyde dehydrogenase family protein [Candidatus Peribacteria bacterium]|jgi:glyceraldehyde-3-phosphate dehydrogenase (NADP+)|nr:aldehyde dehydrogenase family protein [Candidatus Peribacteria bacterium]